MASLVREEPQVAIYFQDARLEVDDANVLKQVVDELDGIQFAMMNLVLHGIRNAHVKRGNTLSEMGGLTEEDLRRRYKVILSNPPFAGVLPKESIRADLPTKSKKSELLFLGVVMESLAPGGRAAVIVPEGLLFGSTAGHVELRRKLIEDFDLQAVVSLPGGVFKPYAGVKTAILIFRRPQNPKSQISNQKSDRVWFYEVKNDGFDPDKVTGGGSQATPGKNDLPNLIAQWRIYKATGFEKPPGVETGTLLEADTPEPTCWWAGTEAIVANDYTLAAGRYKPQTIENAPQEDPVDLIRETLVMEREIASGLEQLLKEVEAVK